MGGTAKLNDATLRANNITYQEEVAGAAGLAQIAAFGCPQPEIVAQGLLDCEAVLSDASFVLLTYEILLASGSLI